MPRATARYTAEIKRSHRSISYVDIIGPTQQTKRLTATDGNITVDGSATTRRACTITCVDPLGQLTPEDAESILTPYGTEIHPYRGVIYDDGTVETYPLGVFRLSKTTVADVVGGSSGGTSGGSPTITVEGFDRSRTVSRNKFTSVYTVPTGTNLIDAIQAILLLTFPDLDYDVVTTSIVTTSPQVYDISSDPWDAVTSLAQSMGCEIYFDASGTCVIAPQLTPWHCLVRSSAI